MQKYKREDVIQKLQRGVVRVNFTKKDGDTRDMKCTLLSSLIPQEMQPKSDTKKITDSTIRVYDIDAQGWRSFIVENIISVDSL